MTWRSAKESHAAGRCGVEARGVQSALERAFLGTFVRPYARLATLGASVRATSWSGSMGDEGSEKGDVVSKTSDGIELCGC